MNPVVKVVPSVLGLFILKPTSVRLKRRSGNSVLGRAEMPQRDLLKSPACKQPLESSFFLFAVPFLDTLLPKNINVKLDCGCRSSVDDKVIKMMIQVELLLIIE